MSLVLCDTNILIEFYKNNLVIVSELKTIGLYRLGISVITKAELYFGALNKSELLKIKRHLGLLDCIPVDIKISEVFIRLMESYALSHKLSIPDALIAATAIVHNLELYTLNTKDFRYIDGIRLYVPKTV